MTKPKRREHLSSLSLAALKVKLLRVYVLEIVANLRALEEGNPGVGV